MPGTVAPHMPTAAAAWLIDDERPVYAEAFERTGFQSGLNWYRAAINPELPPRAERKTIDMPSM